MAHEGPDTGQIYRPCTVYVIIYLLSNHNDLQNLDETPTDEVIFVLSINSGQSIGQDKAESAYF